MARRSRGGIELDARVLQVLLDDDASRAAPSPCLHELWWHWGVPPRVGDVPAQDAPVRLGEHRIWVVDMAVRHRGTSRADATSRRCSSTPVRGWGHDLVEHLYGPAGSPPR